MSFNDKLNSAVQKNNSLLSVGFDPVVDKIPQFLIEKDFPFFEFNKAIIDTTYDLVCAYKFNSAFYEAEGDKGIKELKMSINYIKEKYPEVPTILDAKRGDIDNSNQGYVKYAFDYLGADSLTVMPYMGIQSLQPFFDRKDRGIIIGCHSSNPGAKEFQELIINNKPLYHIVAEEIMKQYGDNPNSMIFMGATYPEELGTIRTIIGDKTILAPGIGAQAGTLEMSVRAGVNSQNKGLIIVIVRGVTYVSTSEDFAEKARQAAKNYRDEINKFRT
ncbi:MAG TPA: orotidine-5'-phosphate decarboxylase [Candidatus Limnocylindrales bacterium]|nr:orotidine-5'-phosphate decarboxylase [Candidatus Limnocylindrales bacterium]